jgi:7,8-dihydropterin-6-yl-methyl-4-(beta-D-ribofuranosyl)aminobenzene 5'-phosphate synthase
MPKSTAYIRSLTVTVLVDDEKGPGDLDGEHGLALWVEADRFRILFDSGAGERLEPNARRLGVDLAEADAFAVSHGHYDHTGGFSCVLGGCGKARFFMHPGALRQRYARRRDGTVHPAGFPLCTGEKLAARKDCVQWTGEITRLHPAIFLTGEIPREEPAEAPGSSFFLDPGCTAADPITDDQALVIDMADGAVVLLGCAHAGVANTLRCALGHSRTGKLRAVIGGLHLRDASPQGLSRVGETLGTLRPQVVCPLHCTGAAAAEELRRRFTTGYTHGRVGAVVKLKGA